MIRRPALITIMMIGAVVAFAAPKGTVPRSSALRYPAHVENHGASLGAKLLTADEVRRAFTSDVNRCCMVIEVGLYPSKDKAADVSLNDFVLHVKNTDTASKASSAKVVAASLQKKARDTRDVTVSPTVGVGYGTGPSYDPVYGPHGGGVTTAAGVGVGIGSRGDQPGSSEKDRSVMETELSEKGLPEGTASAPVAGYLYFSIPRNKKVAYQLEYMLNGEKVLLTLP
jgi:hypothetical protein